MRLQNSLRSNKACAVAPSTRTRCVRCVVAQARRDESCKPTPSTCLKQWLDRSLQKAGSLALAGLMAVSPVALAEEGPNGGIILRLPASDNPEVYTAQQTMFEAWSIVGDSFVDDHFNGHWWPDELKEHMVAAFNTRDGRSAFHEIESMLAELGDPYTRIIPPNEYADFRVSSDGELQGVGLLIANEPYNNHLLVLSAIKGGPADRAGITTGDEVISINDQPTDGWTGDMAAKLLRGKGGTEVRVKFARRTSGIPGVPGRPEPVFRPGTLDDDATVKEVRLRREKLALSPLYYTALQAPSVSADDAVAAGITLASAPASAASSAGFLGGPLTSTSALTAAGGVGMPAAPDRLGYIRLMSFTQNAADETRKAITELEHKGVSGYILDLRDNPGGLVKSGIDIARILLDGHPTVFAITGRQGEPLQQVTLGGEGDGQGPAEALTRRPLVVLVNKRSASASEILSGALHDNHRAVIVGDSNTFGKGRIQSVYELHDGSALFVTVAKYLTPAGTEIDLKGLKPDTSCSLGSAMLQDGPDGSSGVEDGSLAAFLPGMPVGAGAEEALVGSLARDKCVLTAMNMIKDKTHMIQATASVAAHLPNRL